MCVASNDDCTLHANEIRIATSRGAVCAVKPHREPKIPSASGLRHVLSCSFILKAPQLDGLALTKGAVCVRLSVCVATLTASTRIPKHVRAQICCSLMGAKARHPTPDGRQNFDNIVYSDVMVSSDVVAYD